MLTNLDVCSSRRLIATCDAITIRGREPGWRQVSELRAGLQDLVSLLGRHMAAAVLERLKILQRWGVGECVSVFFLGGERGREHAGRRQRAVR